MSDPSQELVRRQAPSVSFSSPDWLVLREVSSDVRAGIERYVRGVVLDVGCGEKPFRCFAPPSTTWIGLDVEANPSADVHGTAEHIPMDDASVDTVLCTQVLEHVPHPWLAVAEIRRVLRPGGVLLLSVPQYWPLHEEPHDYFRFTAPGLRSLLADAGFTIVEMRGEGAGGIVAGQALNNAIFELGAGTPIGTSAPVRILKRALYSVINALSLTLGAAMGSQRDYLNHFVVARV